MVRTINLKITTYKLIMAILIAIALVIFSAIFFRTYKPVDIDQVCKTNKPLFINNIKSCDVVDEVLRSFESNTYKAVTLEDSKQSGGLLRERFDRQIFEIFDYKINGDADSGLAQFKFINGRLSSIVYFPNEPGTAFKLYPETTSEEITVKHHTNYQGRKYIVWSNRHLEAYITWWISKFS